MIDIAIVLASFPGLPTFVNLGTRLYRSTVNDLIAVIFFTHQIATVYSTGVIGYLASPVFLYPLT